MLHPRSPVSRYVTVSFGVGSMIPAWTDSSELLVSQAQAQLNDDQGVAAEALDAGG